ncbi:hypothetical protein GQ43DRAFT_196277 [Delitschia confertaspora ATCC 74209]|uniref:Uncharacterized protein n=1 Tax=Delitschia confertaspora ATCC 74209 TaxID=1513339 RepID=A0A9P4JI52_9PLEO|nr:hypothetical protein GQ43DRAFT_196277 [Delitschia confertaspora ATCC 74209]
MSSFLTLTTEKGTFSSNATLYKAVLTNSLPLAHTAICFGTNPNYTPHTCWQVECGTASSEYKTIFQQCTTCEMIVLLLERGTDLSPSLYSCKKFAPAQNSTDNIRRLLVGLPLLPSSLPERNWSDCIAKSDYQYGRERCFGEVNPERMYIPFWNTMVRWGVGAWKSGKEAEHPPKHPLPNLLTENFPVFGRTPTLMCPTLRPIHHRHLLPLCRRPGR